MFQDVSKPSSLRLILFLLFFWGIGLILAFFWGLGWFFLFESLRRLLTYIPPINQYIRKLSLKPEEDTFPDTHTENHQLAMISRAFGLIITLVWFALTIFVFSKVNIPLKDIFFVHLAK